MPNTIKRTEFYCPINCSGTCARERCALYNDDVRACALSPDSLHLLIRTAITDAAVEIARHLGDVGAPRIMTREEVAALPEGEVVWYEQRMFDGKDYLSAMVTGTNGYIANGSMSVKIATMDGGERCWSARPNDEQREATSWT